MSLKVIESGTKMVPGSVHISEAVHSVSVPASRHQLIKIVFEECPGFCPRATSFLCLRFTHWLYCVGPPDFFAAVCRRHPVAHFCVYRRPDCPAQPSALESCLHSLHSWLCHNGLALNSSKSESILLGTYSRIRNFPPVPGIPIAGSIVPLSYSIVTLGVTPDSNLSFRHHVSKVCRSAHFHLQARHIRSALTDGMAKTVAVSLIHSRIDYANSHIHGSINVRRLQCVGPTELSCQGCIKGPPTPVNYCSSV